jgi:integrase/recombinase XerD
MKARQRMTGVRCWPVMEWPPHDQQAWDAAQFQSDPFEPGGLAAGWSKTTRVMVENGYGRWLAWLCEQEFLVPGQIPASRVTLARLRAYTLALAENNAPLTISTRVRQLGNALRAMAPEQDWRWILRGADRLRLTAAPARDKAGRLVSPKWLVQLGLAIMNEADTTSRETAVRRAADYRDGLIIALLAFCPLRMRNLAMIACGGHLVRYGAEWSLIFAAAETKTGRPLEVPFPEVLNDRLERYLSTHRPVLLDVGTRNGRPTTDALWVSSQGQAAVAATIRFQITERTAAAFGKSVNPHLFRDCAATLVAEEAPEEAPIIARILGHTTMATSDRTYNLARPRGASQRYQAILAARQLSLNI